MLSFVIPVYNEEESLNAFYIELHKTISDLKTDYEIVFIDDGSNDKSLDILKKFALENKKVKIFSFRKNLGKAEALTLGFTKASGDYVVTLDADLQDKPSEIHKLIELSNKGVDVVCGWRKDRKDKSKMKIISHLFNTVMNKVFKLRIHDYNCGLKLYTKDAAKSLRLYGGLHRFIPILAFEQGFSVDEVAIIHASRKYGKSKYSFSKIWKDLPDMFTMLFLVKYGKRPLHFFGIVGGLISLIGILILSYLIIIWFGGESIGNRPLLIFGILFILAGFQVFFTGFLADLMINISQTSKMQSGENSRFPIKYSNEKSLN